ncbi:MAG: TetR/AcrR family transcriptional regulator [Halarsenatibacteraceae bacterium]
METKQVNTDISDGRIERKNRNKNKVLAAFLELVEEQKGLPTAREIANKAGLSRRSIFRYFDNIDELVISAYNYQIKLQQEKFPPPEVPKNERDSIEKAPELVDHLILIYEDTSSIRESLSAQGLPTEVLQKINVLRSQSLRDRIEQHFQDYLNQLEDKENTLYALEVSLSSDSWDYLRNSCGLSIKKAKQVLKGLLKTVLIKHN